MLDELEISDSLRDDYLQNDSPLIVFLDSKNRKATVRDLTSRSTVSELENGSRYKPPFIFSADGSRVAAYTRDGDLVTVWDVASGSELSRYGGQDGVDRTFSLSPDGEYLVVIEREKGFSFRLQLVKADTGKPIDAPDELRSYSQRPSALSFNPNGSEFAVALRDGLVHVYDFDQMVAGKESVRTFEFGDFRYGSKLLFDDDGDVLVAIAEKSGLMRVWDLSTEEVLNSFRDTAARQVSRVSISPDGKHLAAVDNEGVTRLWDVASSVGTDTIMSKSDNFRAMAVSPDSYRVASLATFGRLEVHDLRTGELLAELQADGLRSPIALIQYSPDGVHLAGMKFNGDVLLWNMLTGGLVKTFESGALAAEPLMAFNSDGSLLAVNYGYTDKQIKI